jgi:hypothetical protein
LTTPPVVPEGVKTVELEGSLRLRVLVLADLRE